MQKFNQKIALVHHKDNQELAQQLENELTTAIDFHAISCCRDKNGSITDALQNFDGPIILLISDNFLRTSQCMQDGLKMLNEHEENLLAVVIPGYNITEDGKKEVISTDFSRFKQVVQYINFWQDRYLDLRKQKRSDPDLDTPGFTDYLHNIRDIAGEAGQYLRLLQTLSPIDWETFRSNDYEILFEFLEEDVLWENFKSSTPAKTTEVPLEQLTVEYKTIHPEPKNTATKEEATEESDHTKEITSIIATAWVLEENNEPDTAIAQIKVAIDRYPENTALKYNLAVLLMSQAKYDLAKEEVNSLLDMAKENEDVLFLAAELAVIQEKTSKAIAYFEQLALLNEDYPSIFYRLARLKQKQGNSPVESIELLYKKAIKKDKKHSSAHYQLAQLYMNGLSHTEKAEKHLKKTIKLDAKHPFAHYDLASIFHQNQSFKKANKHYLQSIELEPSLETTENKLAFSLENKLLQDNPVAKIQRIKDKIKQLELELEGLTKE